MRYSTDRLENLGFAIIEIAAVAFGAHILWEWPLDIFTIAGISAAHFLICYAFAELNLP